MGKDRRKKDGNRKQADTSVPNDACSQPKAQREPRNRAPQEQRRTDTNKNTDSSVRDKISDHTTSQPDSKPGEESSRILSSEQSLTVISAIHLYVVMKDGWHMENYSTFHVCHFLPIFPKIILKKLEHDVIVKNPCTKYMCSK
jgi:hypothetical protein